MEGAGGRVEDGQGNKDGDRFRFGELLANCPMACFFPPPHLLVVLPEYINPLPPFFLRSFTSPSFSHSTSLSPQLSFPMPQPQSAIPQDSLLDKVVLITGMSPSFPSPHLSAP